jgi:integrase
MGVQLKERELPSGKSSLVIVTYHPGKRKMKTSAGRKGTQKFRATGYILTGDKKHDDEMYVKARILLGKELEKFASGRGDSSPSDFEETSFISYMRQLAEDKKRPNTRIGWLQALKHFEAFMEGQDVTFGELNRRLFERFKEYLEKEVRTANSANSYLMRVKAALSHAIHDERLAENPARHITIKTTRKLPTYLTLDEVQQLASTPIRNINVRNAFLFSCFSGLRVSDVQALQWEQIVDGHIKFSQVKTGSPEILPLSEQAKAILEDQRRISPNGNIFILPSTQAIDGQLLTWAKAAGVKRFSFHISRHTFAVLALEIGDIYMVSKLLGHKDLKTTQIYATVTDRRKQDAVAKLPRIELPSTVDRGV